MVVVPWYLVAVIVAAFTHAALTTKEKSCRDLCLSQDWESYEIRDGRCECFDPEDPVLVESTHPIGG